MTNNMQKQIENMAEVAGMAYGWDSEEAAKYRKEVGVRALALNDWPRAIKSLSLSLEAHEALYGRQDKRTQSIISLLQKAQGYREEIRLAPPANSYAF
jgi:hypothetical protein